jgi:hypothetical protein
MIPGAGRPGGGCRVGGRRHEDYCELGFQWRMWSQRHHGGARLPRQAPEGAPHAQVRTPHRITIGLEAKAGSRFDNSEIAKWLDHTVGKLDMR